MREKPLILIVDDEENFREIFSAKLGAAGFETAVANGEVEALQKAKELMPDLILMDIFMPPGATGTDVALNIHQSPETRNLKIAFLTNLKDPWPAISGDHQNVSKEMGMEDFLEKTADLDNIAAKVKEILARGDGSAQPTPPVQAPVAPAQPVQQSSAPVPIESVPVQIPVEASMETQVQQPEMPQQPPAQPPQSPASG
ncbi:MAG: response regulator [Patescibacteria group bacterium]